MSQETNQPTLTPQEQNARDAERRKKHAEETQAVVEAMLDNEDGFSRIEQVTDDEWDRAQRLDDEESEAEGETEPEILPPLLAALRAGEVRHSDGALDARDLAMALDWHLLLDGFSRVMKLVHLAARMDQVDEERIKAELLRQGRKAYEDELTIQAQRSGCGGRHGMLSSGPILSELNDVYVQHAASIVNTYNYDLAAQIAVIRQDVPRANRYTYAKRLRRWHQVRGEFKNPTITLMTESTARSLAQEHFFARNGYEGYAELEPTTAVCPVCQGWIDRGRVPLKVAMNHPPPYHIRCPHAFLTFTEKFTPEQCELLWMGE